jgi:hypothetical protein
LPLVSWITACPWPSSATPAAGITGVDATGRAGLFFNERTNEPLRLVANNGRLAIAGGGPLLTLAADRFQPARVRTEFMSNDRFELHFLSNDQFELKSMEGAATRYRRAQPYTPAAEDLKPFAARYESHELRAELRVEPAARGLMVHLNDRPAIEFAPVDRDTFQRGMQTLRFRRDATGKVAGFDFTNPVLRNVTFTRVSDGASGR